MAEPARILPLRQRGLALITAMLVVALAATTAAYLAIDQQIWLRQSQNLTDRAQADVVRAGAEEWAITILAKDAKDNPQSDDLTEDWAKELPPLAVEGGQLRGRIFDAQAKFNLNNLVQGTNPSPENIGFFKQLLQQLSLDPNLTDAVIDWIDADSDTRPAGAEDLDYLQMKVPSRAANQPLQSVEELRLIRGFTPEIVDKLRPWVVALPQPTAINVNTAPKEVLGALFHTLPTSVIDKFIEQRPYKEAAKFSGQLQELATGLQIPQNLPPYGIQSSYFEVIVETRFGRYQRTTQALIHRSGGPAGFRVQWHSQILPGWLAVRQNNENTNAAKPGNI